MDPHLQLLPLSHERGREDRNRIRQKSKRRRRRRKYHSSSDRSVPLGTLRWCQSWTQLLRMKHMDVGSEYRYPSAPCSTLSIQLSCLLISYRMRIGGMSQWTMLTWHGPSRGARGAVPFVHDFGSRREKVQHLDGELWTFRIFFILEFNRFRSTRGCDRKCQGASTSRQTYVSTLEWLPSNTARYIYLTSIPSAVVGADGPPYGIPGTGSTIDVWIGIAYLASSKSRLLVIFVL